MSDLGMGRLIAQANMAIFALAWVIFLVTPASISAADLIATGVLALAAAYTLVAVPAAIRRSVRPLPAGLSEDEGARHAQEQLKNATALAAPLSLTMPYLALFVGMITGNPWTYAVPFVVGEVLLYRYGWPGRATAAEVRRALEAPVPGSR